MAGTPEKGRRSKATRARRWFRLPKMSSITPFSSPFANLFGVEKLRIFGPRTQLLATVVCLIAIMVFLVDRIGGYFNWPPQIYSDPSVYNLTNEKVLWDVYYGKSAMCGAVECHLTDDLPKEQFTKSVVLPVREFPLVGYKQGQIIYARTHITLPQHLRAAAEPITFHSTYIFAESYDFYINGVLLESGQSELMNVTIPRTLIPASGELRIAMRIDPGKLTYQGLAHRGDIVIGPKVKLAETAFLARDLTTNVHLWFLLPKLTFCAMFAFIFIAVFRSMDTFAFTMYAFLGSSELFLRSGFAEEMLPWLENAEFLGIIARNFSFIFLFLFLCEFFRLRPKRLVVSFYTLLTAYIVVSIACVFLLPPRLAYQINDWVIVFLRPFVIGFAVYGAIKTYQGTIDAQAVRAKFAVILSGFFLLFFVFIATESVFLVMDMFGLNANRPVLLTQAVDVAFFFVLAAITSVEFGYEISAKQRIENELRVVEERLELGRSVQSLLLPKDFTGSQLGTSFKFFYQPAEKMSGDWLNIWQMGDEMRLFFGDVVGKGPQAALAVAVVASTIAEARRSNATTEEALRLINERLYVLFEGRINSVCYAIAIRPEGQVELFNCGALGWLNWSAAGLKHLPVRGGSPLGNGIEARIGKQLLTLGRDETLFAFTDGCLEGGRGLKLLQRRLAERVVPVADFDQLYQLVIETGADIVHEDDKTMLAVTRSAVEKKATGQPAA